MSKTLNNTLYQKRRQRLLTQLPSASALILPGAQEVIRNGDVTYPFRQQSDFYYLTGFNEPNALLILSPNHPQGDFILFCNPKNALMETWHGARAGQTDACDVYGANCSFSTETLTEQLPKILEACRQIYYPLGSAEVIENIILQAIDKARTEGRRGNAMPEALHNSDSLLHPMRQIKDDHEKSLLQHAATIAGAGHHKAMQLSQANLYEYQLQATINHHFENNGCVGAYAPIVAGGNNACTLHYVLNNQLLKDGDLVLIDMGAEYQGYASDITRTFPVNGKFSQAQQAIYEVVLAANIAGINAIKVGVLWTAIQEAVVAVITQGLIDLKILSGTLADNIANKTYFPFYMHGASHWIGLDVHDVGFYKNETTVQALQPGMYMSLEPGIYIKQGMENVDEKWWGMGIRIEDDVMCAEDGPQVFTKNCVKTVDEITHMMKNP